MVSYSKGELEETTGREGPLSAEDTGDVSAGPEQISVNGQWATVKCQAVQQRNSPIFPGYSTGKCKINISTILHFHSHYCIGMLTWSPSLLGHL